MARGKRRARTSGEGPARPLGGEGPAAASGGQDSVVVPGWLPPVLYAALTLWLFGAFVFSDAMLYGSDTLALGYVARKFFADALASGVFPAWNPQILGGTPFLESLAGGDSLYPTSLLLLLIEPYRALGWKLVLHVFLAALFMFGWVRALGLSRAAALLAGIAYGFAPFLVSFVRPGHDGKLFVSALAPLLFWVCERTFRRPGLLPYVAVAMVVALVILTTHFQKAYFLFGAVGAFYLFRTVQLWRGADDASGAPVASGPRPALTRLGLFLAAALAGAGVAGVQLVPAVDYVLEHSRRTATTVSAEAEDNVAYSSSWSLHPEELVSLLVPEFAGNNARGAAWATDTYWGRNAFKDNHETAGLVVLLLSGLAFLGAPRRGLRFFFLGLGALALLFALGRNTPVWRIFYEVVPGVSLFRAPSQAAFLFGFAAVTLAAFGIDRALAWARGGGEDEDGGREAVRYLWACAGLVFMLTVLAGSGALLTAWTSVFAGQMTVGSLDALGRATPFIQRGFLVATLLACATAAAVWAGRRGLLMPSGVAALLGLLLTVDALRIDAAFIQTIPFEAVAASDDNVEYLLERQRESPPFRVMSLDNGGQDVRPALFGLELASGHHPNDLARYRELIGMAGSGIPENLIFEGPNVPRLLGLRFVLAAAELGSLVQQDMGGTPVSQVNAPPYEALFELPALPRARLVAEALVVPDAEAVARILDPAFDPARTAVLPEAPPFALGGGEPNGTVVWEERGTNQMRLRVTSDRDALLVLADNWFPAWHATVNGEEAPVLRAYHALRAVPVRAGDHTVELFYRSNVLRGSFVLSLTTLALVLAVGGVSYARSRGGGAA